MRLYTYGVQAKGVGIHAATHTIASSHYNFISGMPSDIVWTSSECDYLKHLLFTESLQARGARYPQRTVLTMQIVRVQLPGAAPFWSSISNNVRFGESM